MKVRHPAFPEIVRDVETFAGWKGSGWLPVETPKPRPRKKSPGKRAGDTEENAES